jgi:hypothetical protein
VPALATGSHDFWLNFYFHENATVPAVYTVAATSSKAWKKDLGGVRTEREFWREW